MLLYDLVSQKAQNLNYGSYEKKDSGSEQKLGRPRALTLFEEFVLTLMRLRLGLFQKHGQKSRTASGSDRRLILCEC